ncbi:MAG: 5-formyltetrahydrofolate cyclo-ligase [Prosthecobacter sp.]|nr:5-formyltetrahydrofolate cyclo-ligase [Prosthecobacter sp.]
MAEMTDTWTKEAVRRSIRERFRAVPEGTLRRWSEQLVSRLQAREDLWARPGVAALFGGLRNEPDLVTSFLPWLRNHGWRTVFFKVAQAGLVPVEVVGVEDLRRGPLGVWEPSGSEPADIGELDVILVPGLAFSARDGARLGRGGGYYDRLLAQPRMRARLVGVGFHMQLLPDVPCEPHDARIPDLVTEL